MAAKCAFATLTPIMYRVLDENGVVIADGTGKLEAAAWDEFYGQNG
jgi:hypothetical protein